MSDWATPILVTACTLIPFFMFIRALDRIAAALEGIRIEGQAIRIELDCIDNGLRDLVELTERGAAKDG